MGPRIDVFDLNIYYGSFHAVADVSMTMEPRTVTALIGPSGSGKSTLLRAVNRMHEEISDAYVTGHVELGGSDVYGPLVDRVAVRRQVGMVFSRPNLFPSMSIFDNAASGLRLTGVGDKRVLSEAVERALRRTYLWNELKDRLGRPANYLSGDQQQRLCIARAVAVEPQVLLMDGPCSALDPISTLAIEDLISELKAAYTVVIVTSDLKQAARVSDQTAYFDLAAPSSPSRLVEIGATEKIFSNPDIKATEDYITGRFG